MQKQFFYKTVLGVSLILGLAGNKACFGSGLPHILEERLRTYRNLIRSSHLTHTERENVTTWAVVRVSTFMRPLVWPTGGMPISSHDEYLRVPPSNVRSLSGVVGLIGRDMMHSICEYNGSDANEVRFGIWNEVARRLRNIEEN